MRRWRRRHVSPWYVVAAVLALGAWIGTMRVAAGGPRIDIMVAARDLPAGADVSDASLVATIRIPADAALPGMLQRVDQLSGRFTVAPVGAGEPLTQATLGGRPGAIPAPLAPGERAVSLPAATAGAALPILVAGARIDIVASLGDAGDARMIVRGAEVISSHLPVDGAAASEGGAILVRVREADALKLSGALDYAAGVRVLPRPYREAVAP